MSDARLVEAARRARDFLANIDPFVMVEPKHRKFERPWKEDACRLYHELDAAIQDSESAERSCPGKYYYGGSDGRPWTVVDVDDKGYVTLERATTEFEQREYHKPPIERAGVNAEMWKRKAPVCLPRR